MAASEGPRRELNEASTLEGYMKENDKEMKQQEDISSIVGMELPPFLRIVSGLYADCLHKLSLG